MEVYCIKNTVNGKCYVGRTTKTFQERYGGRWWNSTQNIPLKRAVKKYGVSSFTVSILEKTDSFEILYSKEIYWISKLSSTKPTGYNLTGGGDGGTLMLDSTKKKISDSMLKAFHPNKGVYKQLKETSCKVCGKSVKSYLSSIGTFRATCSRKCHQELSSINAAKQMKNKRIAVEAVSKQGVVLRSFDCLEDAKKDGFHIFNIRECLKGKRKTHKKMIWRKAA